MLKSTLPLALVAALLSTAVSASESDVSELFQSEKQNLNQVSDDRIQELLTSIKPRQRKAERPTVSFSKAWLDAQPRPTGDAQWRCLSEALYFEARGETVKGQFAVAEVIMNRVESSRFPDTLCGVIKQGTGKRYQCQFTYTCDGNKEVIAEPKAFERVSKVARATIDGTAGDLTKGATHYHTKWVSPRWSRVYTRTAQIGVHLFYRHTYRTASTE